MAEYYPLLVKAIATVPDSTPETRRVVYERARKALLGQLRALQPPVPEADVERESQALDSAIARLEAEFAAKAATAAEPAADRPSAETTPVTPPTVTPVTITGITVTATAPAPAGPPPQITPEPPAEAAKPTLRPRPAVVPPLPEASVSSGPDTPPPTAEEPIPSGESEALPGLLPKMRPEAQRPIAPQAKPQRQSARGLWIVMAVIAIFVAGIAVAAWKLRDRPEDIAKLKSAPAQQTEGSGKIISRADESGPATDASSGAANPAQATAPAPNVPVTYRAALLVQAPEEPNKVKTYFGTVIWRLDNVSNGPGEPLGTAIHANVDIPEDKFQVSWTLQKNMDSNLPATHTMMVVFTLQPTTPTGGIKQIGVPQMRREDSANGEALAGLPVPVMENSFLIGLARGNSEAPNLDLLKTRQWVDIPILLTSGRIAKLTFEKGVAGQRTMDDALASWQAQ